MWGVGKSMRLRMTLKVFGLSNWKNGLLVLKIKRGVGLVGEGGRSGTLFWTC